MSDDTSGCGISRRRMREMLRDSVFPEPVPQDVTIADGASVAVNFTVSGLNFRPDTKIVFVPDGADPAVVLITDPVFTYTRAPQDQLGTLEFAATFIDVPIDTNLFQMFLTGPYGQRVYLGALHGA